MFKRILVPLDGSRRAERALSVAARIARLADSTVVLLHVAGLGIEYGPYLAQGPSLLESVLEQDLETATAYLDSLLYNADLAGIRTETVVIPGVEAQTILTYARLSNIDLIVLSSRGYTGLKRWALGSVAHKIARYSSIPTLILREESPGQLLAMEQQRPLQVVVALDGSPLAETVIAPAAMLIAAWSAPESGVLHLTQVVKPAATDSDERRDNRGKLQDKLHTAVVREQAACDAAVYLSRLSARLYTELAAKLGIIITWSVVAGDDVAHELIKVTEQGQGAKVGECETADLIAMTTHGRGGLERWMMGSVTERVLAGTKLPVLVMRPQIGQTTSKQPTVHEKSKEFVAARRR